MKLSKGYRDFLLHTTAENRLRIGETNVNNNRTISASVSSASFYKTLLKMIRQGKP